MRGIEEANRALLERLHRNASGPYSIEEAASMLAVDQRRAGRLLRYLAEQGWLSRVREWGLREDVVEKDYVIGWVLWGIGQNPVLQSSWAFKGGEK